MKLILIVFFSLLYGMQESAANCDSLPKAKPPIKIAKMDNKAVAIKISFDSLTKEKRSGKQLLDRRLVIVQKSNTTETEQKQIFIRCGFSIGTDPLIVLDGIPVDKHDMSDLKTDDIESVSVLKASAAQAIYGYRAMGGVILITTKSANERRILVKDDQNNRLPGATVTVLPNNSISDTILLVADKEGIVSTNKLKKNYNYEIAVSHIGYESRKTSIGKKEFQTEVILNRKITECFPVHVITYGRTIRCGISTKVIRERGGKAYLINNHSFKVYPNPALEGSFVTLQLSEEVSEEIKLQLYDLSGRLVLQKEIENKVKLQKMQIPKMAAGNYHLILLNKKAEKVFANKLVIL